MSNKHTSILRVDIANEKDYCTRSRGMIEEKNVLFLSGRRATDKSSQQISLRLCDVDFKRRLWFKFCILASGQLRKISGWTLFIYYRFGLRLRWTDPSVDVAFRQERTRIN